MNPAVWIYGGVHDDPGSRRRFLAELSKQPNAPRLVAVEWEQTIFERFAARRPWIEEALRSSWEFLTREDCHELSLAFAWEGDAHAPRFPDSDVLWLENGFSEADLERRYGVEEASRVPERRAHSFLERLRNPCQRTLAEWSAKAAPPPEPTSMKDLVDRVWRKAWSGALGDEDVERDERWANEICERSASLSDGWIAVVVGWQHADPAAGERRLQGLLSSRGLLVRSVCLGP